MEQTTVSSPRVRFAPSPTGFLHIGGARTALFNRLFARRMGGVFILRIEDTDIERSSPEMVDGILEALRWLGLSWDEGPFFQSARLEHHQQTAARLLADGAAYREAGDDGRYAVRFRVPRGEIIRFEDRIFGSIEVSTDTLEDFVLLRSDGHPTYHLSVVADDTQMEVTHVIRGADHLSNTAKHVLLYRALGRPLPVYAHLPLILGPDRKRLSKRHGATSVLEYREQGFLPEALRNYLALLGWSPGDDREFFNEDELIQAFDLDRVNKANAVFDREKLEWMNGRYLAELKGESLIEAVEPFLKKVGLWQSGWEGQERSTLLAALELIRPRVRRLTEFAGYGYPFFSDAFEYEPEAIEKFLPPAGSPARGALQAALPELRAAFQRLEPFDVEHAEKIVREVAERHGIKAGSLFGAVRVALTGRAAAPGIFDIIVTLGRERVIQRLDRLAGRMKDEG